jgi:Pyrimidine dimer DNA glycosylase
MVSESSINSLIYYGRNIIITFMPYPNFKESIKCLDRQRLNSQRREALHILKASLGMVRPFKSHASIKMWSGAEKALCLYGLEACNEWYNRGYVDNQGLLFELIDHQEFRNKPLIMPRWLGCEQFHSNQRARLLSKNYTWYSQFSWKEEPTEIYWFPESLYGV